MTTTIDDERVAAGALRLLHHLGLRFRLHRKDLPGTPDVVLPKYQTALFIHGCFWHRHPECRFSTTPRANKAFWEAKFAANVERDARKTRELEVLGWRVLVVWGCETRDLLTRQSNSQITERSERTHG